jgi:Flp pilus assembly protein TadG
MAMPMFAQSLSAPARGMLDGRRLGSRRIGARLLACRAGNVVVEFALAAPV